MYVTLKMAKPRSVALKTAEDPGREGFAAEGSIGTLLQGGNRNAHVSQKTKPKKRNT
jgi:hypothetical protein